MSNRTAPSLRQVVGEHHPFWQTLPCPAWCWGHHSDRAEDRSHLSDWDKRVALSLHDPEVTFDSGKLVAEPVEVVVLLRQHYREVEPVVVLEPEGPAGGKALEFTPAEAEKVACALLKAVKLAGGAK